MITQIITPRKLELPMNETLPALALLVATLLAWREDRQSHGDVNRVITTFLIACAVGLVAATLLE